MLLPNEVRKTTVQTAAVNPVLLRLAEEAELVERDGEDLAPGEDAEWLDDLADDSDALDAWEYAFAVVLDTTLEEADDSDPVVADDLDLEGHGPALVMSLFLSLRDGVRITELAGALKDAATADLAAEEADRQWQEWVDAHGDPLRLLLDQLERLGAVSVTDDAVRLEPLGVQAVRSKLERDHLFVPVLPAPDKMTPTIWCSCGCMAATTTSRPSWPHGRTRAARSRPRGSCLPSRRTETPRRGPRR